MLQARAPTKGGPTEASETSLDPPLGSILVAVSLSILAEMPFESQRKK